VVSPIFPPVLVALLVLLRPDAPVFERAEPRADADPEIIIERREPTVERLTFDPKNPPPDMPPLESGEAALCQFNFNCTVNLKYEVVEQSNDSGGGGSDGRGGESSVAAHVRQIRITLTLHNKIYLPRGAPPKIRAHEEGHRIINERVYEQAERVARRAALEVLTQTWRGRGADGDAAGKAATDVAVRQLCDAYLAGTAGKASRVGDIYDDLTDHGRNTRLTEADAIRQAFARAAADNTDAEAPAPATHR
jgi:hypothetical protein